MPVPAASSMEPGVNDVVGSDQFVRQPRGADGAEYQAAVAKPAIDGFAPPTLMAELDRVSILRIELPRDARKPRRRVAITRRKLEEKTAELLGQDFFDLAKFFHEHLRSHEPLLVGDEPIDFHRVAKILRRVATPSFHRADLRPTVEWSIQFHRVESRSVVLEPGIGSFRVRIKNPAPMPVK